MSEQKKISQTEAIYNHLKTHGCITSMEAFELYGATRLSAIIFTLRKRYGYSILTEDKECITRWGRKVRYANYILVNHE